MDAPKEMVRRDAVVRLPYNQRMLRLAIRTKLMLAMSFGEDDYEDTCFDVTVDGESLEYKVTSVVTGDNSLAVASRFCYPHEDEDLVEVHSIVFDYDAESTGYVPRRYLLVHDGAIRPLTDFL